MQDTATGLYQVKTGMSSTNQGTVYQEPPEVPLHKLELFVRVYTNNEYTVTGLVQPREYDADTGDTFYKLIGKSTRTGNCNIHINIWAVQRAQKTLLWGKERGQVFDKFRYHVHAYLFDWIEEEFPAVWGL